MIDSTRAFAKLIAAFNQNDWPRVQQRSSQLLVLAPDDARLHFMAGIADMQMGDLTTALARLKRATHLAPRRADYVAQYAKALSLLRRTREARLVADRAMTLAPVDALTLDTLGLVYAQANAPIQSATAFRRAAALMPEHAPSRYNLAQSLTLLNDIDGAEHEFDACIERDPRQWRAWLERSRLHPQTSERNHQAALQVALHDYVDQPVAQLHLHLALGKECDDLGDYPRAFAHFSQGKAAGRRLRPYDAAREAAMFNALARAAPASPSTATDTPGPVFLVGIPCSGVAQLDHALRQHPDVRPSEGRFTDLLHQASGQRGHLLAAPDLATRLAPIDWPRLGAAWRASMQAGATPTSRLVDHTPLNLLLVGAIARALPEAKFVCLRRHPLDTCLANFTQLFDPPQQGVDYSYALTDIGRYYVRCQRLLAYWRQLLPGRLLELSYEALHADRPACLREALSFCDLSWHDACLPAPPPAMPAAIHPIGHWRHYAHELEPLRAQLRAAGIDTGD